MKIILIQMEEGAFPCDSFTSNHDLAQFLILQLGKFRVPAKVRTLTDFQREEDAKSLLVGLGYELIQKGSLVHLAVENFRKQEGIKSN